MTTFPFYWMLITSLKSNSDLYNVTNIPFWFNEAPTLEHFEYLFEQTLFTRWLWNSLVIGLCVTAITLVTAVPAGYSLARMTGRTAESLGIGIFLTYLVPPTLLFLPLSRIIAELGLQNSMWSLVVVYPTFTIPFCTWLLMGFFKAIPPEIEEAAIVDGCSLFGAFIKMVIPLSVPAILTVIIFTFTLTLQEFVYALTFVSAADQKPITLGVTTDLVRGDVFFWGEIMAGALDRQHPGGDRLQSVPRPLHLRHHRRRGQIGRQPRRKRRDRACRSRGNSRQSRPNPQGGDVAIILRSLDRAIGWLVASVKWLALPLDRGAVPAMAAARHRARLVARGQRSRPDRLRAVRGAERHRRNAGAHASRRRSGGAALFASERARGLRGLGAALGLLPWAVFVLIASRTVRDVERARSWRLSRTPAIPAIS